VAGGVKGSAHSQSSRTEMTAGASQGCLILLWRRRCRNCLLFVVAADEEQKRLRGGGRGETLGGDFKRA